VDPATLIRDDGNPLLVLERRTHWKSVVVSEIWTMWHPPDAVQEVPQHDGDERTGLPAYDEERTA